MLNMVSFFIGVNPVADTLTELYTPGTGKSSQANVFVTNTGAAPTKIRIAIRQAASPGPEYAYLIYNKDIAPGQTINLTGLNIPIVGAVAYGIYVYCQEAVCTFSATGIETYQT